MTNIAHLGESHDQHRTLLESPTQKRGVGGSNVPPILFAIYTVVHFFGSHDQYSTLGGIT